MSLVCVKCHKSIIDRQYLTCSICKYTYHLDCTSVSSVRFYLMEQHRKTTWKCYTCRERVREGNQNVSPSISAAQNADSAITTHISPNSLENITIRDPKHKIKCNIPIENSFESLSVDDDEEEDENSLLRRGNMSRSCPDLQCNIYAKVEEMEKKINHLQEKLARADNEVVNLLSENYTLKEMIANNERTINQLKNLCKPTPLKSMKKNKRKSMNEVKSTLSNETKLENQSFCDLHVEQEESYIAYDHKSTSENRLRQLAPSQDGNIASVSTETNTPKVTNFENLNINKNHQELRPHRVLLLADENGRGLASVLQKLLGSNFNVNSFIKPNRSSNDNNLMKLVSFLYCNLSLMTNTNVLLCELHRNDHIYKKIVNKNFRKVVSNNVNSHFVETYTWFGKIDKLNTCRSLWRTIMHVKSLNERSGLISHISLGLSYPMGCDIDLEKTVGDDQTTNKTKMFFRD